MFIDNKKVNNALKCAKQQRRAVSKRRAQEYARFSEDIDLRQALINAYIDDSQAKSTPVELYAAWLTLYLNQGGHITHSYDYEFRGSGFLTPTKHTAYPIPTAYGAQAMHLLILDQVASVPLEPTSGDERTGWEWGHGTVCRVYRDDIGGLVAWTNQPNVIQSFTDVEAMMATWVGGKSEKLVRLCRSAT